MDDIEAIKQLKARYCRTMDTKDWAAMRQVFADDVDDGHDGFRRRRRDRRRRLPRVPRKRRSARWSPSTTATCPRSSVTSPTTASGVWAMEDMLRLADGTELHGYGHYHETYEKRRR